ncbi:nucleotidyltransferase domain-containing protein [Butyrivibrio sp. XPD2006]|uniref:nucleotidyltransferase domain-containing protein n=1 Tax=Butyrivibrio sp. XPD2006 TaxID=1280668 RepID=UPI0003B60D59|nr:nucleotidyltransferase family protein [Butyrivibrio sp. XPD2006]
MVDLLFYLAKCAIYRIKPTDFKEKFGQKSIDWDSFFKLAIDNNMITLIYSIILEIDKENNILNEQQRKSFEVNAKATLIPELQKFYLVSQLAKASEERGIRFVFFKGVVLADLYPQYVERVSSDSDIYVLDKYRESAEEILREFGYIIDPADSKENVKVYIHKNPKHMVELHTKLWEDYKGPRIDILAGLGLTDEIIRIEACNIPLYTLNHENHLIYQLFHIIKHFSLEGIGARYLVDITLFINRYIDQIDIDEFWKKIDKLGYTKFAEVFFSICMRSLSMDTRIMVGHRRLPDDLVDVLMTDLFHVGSARDKEARWQIMGAMEAYFTGEEKVSKTKLGKKIRMAFPSAKAMPKVYSYARKYPILLPIAWIHRDFKFLLKKIVHRNDFYGVGEKIEVGERRLSLLEEFGLIDEE